MVPTKYRKKKAKLFPGKFDVRPVALLLFLSPNLFIYIKGCLFSGFVQHLPFHSEKRDAAWFVNKCLLITSGPLGRIELEPGAIPLCSMVIFGGFLRFPCRRWRNMFLWLTIVIMEIFVFIPVNARILKLDWLFLAEWWAVWF